MIGYGASAQVMTFFLPLYLENAYGFEPLLAGIAMIPFALPMVLAPRITHQLATRFSGPSLLAAGLAITVVGSVAFWLVGRSHLPYGVFLVAMVIAGCGAGLLNGQTVKVLQGAVPEDRAGMASGIANTTRFICILVSVAARGGILSDVARDRFVAGASKAGLAADAARQVAARVTSDDLAGLLAAAPAAARDALHSIALAAYGAGFASAAVVAACVAFIACVLAYGLISSQETAPVTPPPHQKMPCKMIDWVTRFDPLSSGREHADLERTMPMMSTQITRDAACTVSGRPEPNNIMWAPTRLSFHFLLFVNLSAH